MKEEAYGLQVAGLWCGGVKAQSLQAYSLKRKSLKGSWRPLITCGPQVSLGGITGWSLAAVWFPGILKNSYNKPPTDHSRTSNSAFRLQPSAFSLSAHVSFQSWCRMEGGKKVASWRRRKTVSPLRLQAALQTSNPPSFTPQHSSLRKDPKKLPCGFEVEWQRVDAGFWVHRVEACCRQLLDTWHVLEGWAADGKKKDQQSADVPFKEMPTMLSLWPFNGLPVRD